MLSQCATHPDCEGSTVDDVGCRRGRMVYLASSRESHFNILVGRVLVGTVLTLATYA